MVLVLAVEKGQRLTKAENETVNTAWLSVQSRNSSASHMMQSTRGETIVETRFSLGNIDNEGWNLKLRINEDNQRLSFQSKGWEMHAPDARHGARTARINSNCIQLGGSDTILWRVGTGESSYEI
jgi:hypothetical protein